MVAAWAVCVVIIGLPLALYGSLYGHTDGWYVILGMALCGWADVTVRAARDWWRGE